LAVALLFVKKIRQSGLRIVGFLQIFQSQAVISRTIFDSPAFLENGSAEKIVPIQPVIPTRRMIRGIFVESGPEL
jgi:hypothetical protein